MTAACLCLVTPRPARGRLLLLCSSGGPESRARSHDPSSSSPPEGTSELSPVSFVSSPLLASPGKSRSGPAVICGLTRYFWQDPNKRCPAQEVAVVTVEGMGASHGLFPCMSSLESTSASRASQSILPTAACVPASCPAVRFGPDFSLEPQWGSHSPHLGPHSCPLLSISAIPPPEGPPTSGPVFCLLPSLPCS